MRIPNLLIIVFVGALLGVACGGSGDEVEATDDTVEDTGGEVTDDGADETDDDGDSDEIQAMPYGAPPRRDRLV